MSDRVEVTSSEEMETLLVGRTIDAAEMLIAEGDLIGSLILRLSGDLTLYCDAPTLYKSAVRLHTNHHRAESV